jgi:CMP-N-acetylneuraminic acid synthetase
VAGLNVQDQQKIVWPAKLVMAKAYVDQLERSQALPADRIAALRAAIHGAESSRMNKGKVAKLSGMAPSLEQSAATAKSPADSARLHALADILKHPSA